MGLIKNEDVYHPELSYRITGLFFKIHNDYGRFKLERQYCDVFEKLLLENNIKYHREKDLRKIFPDAELKGNIPDFVIEEKVIVDFKNKKFLTKEDYYQMMRYLEFAQLPLGVIVNFRSSYLKPKRIINPHFHSRHSGDHS